MDALIIILSSLLLSYGLQVPFRWLVQRYALRRRRAYFFSGLAVAVALAAPLGLLLGERAQALFWVLAAAFVCGSLADALRFPRFVQVLLGIAISYWAVQQGFVISELKPPFFQGYVGLGKWATPLTVAWIGAVAYAIILCRRLPGLVGGLTGIVSLAFLAVTSIVFAIPNPLTAPLACAAAGAALGTFPHDMPYRSASLKAILGGEGPLPSPLPQGAAGHWVLGFALALLSVVGFLKNTAFLLLAAPLLLLGVPLVEATYAFVYGGLNRRFSFSVGQRRELLHEALLKGGLSPRRSVFIFLAITAYFSIVAILLALLVQVSFLIKFVLLLIFIAAGFVVFFCAARILSRRSLVATPVPEKIDFLDIPVTVVDTPGALQKVEAYVQERTPRMVATTDSSAIVRAHSDEELAEILKAADLVTPDGAGVVWMAKVLGLPIEQRVSGVDLIDKICALGATRGWSVFLLGAEPGIAEAAAQKLTERHPGLRVAGCRHGYFTPEEEPDLIADIAAKKPDVLFVAFGIPRQEKWISKHMHTLGVPVAIGVGGSFDVISGRLKRAPRWMQVAGLEWLFRTLQQPKRIPRLIALPKLFLMTLREALLKRR